MVARLPSELDAYDLTITEFGTVADLIETITWHHILLSKPYHEHISIPASDYGLTFKGGT